MENDGDEEGSSDQLWRDVDRFQQRDCGCLIQQAKPRQMDGGGEQVGWEARHAVRVMGRRDRVEERRMSGGTSRLDVVEEMVSSAPAPHEMPVPHALQPRSTWRR